jgi:hypothetical protein
VPSQILRRNNRLLEINRPFLHIHTVTRARPAPAPIQPDGLHWAGGRPRRCRDRSQWWV